jgi:ribonuclease T1
LKGFVVRAGILKLVLAHIVVLIAFAWCGVQAKPALESTALPTIAAEQLPAQGRETLQLIHRGGPFPNEKDGVIFGNRERLLPLQQRGFYREYTVRTPGLRHRGARRIVCGGIPKAPDVCYYTDDHYASYRRIVP